MAPMDDKTLAQVAYETYAQHMDAWRRWQDLRPPEHDAWEAAVTAVIAARRVRNVVITACTDPGCGDGCDG
jgi:hypothetical protein